MARHNLIKKWTTRAAALAVMFVLTVSTAWACSPHWISGIYEHGELVQLEDGSLWKVSAVCALECKSWEVGSNVTVCDQDTKMRNVDLPKEKQDWIHVKRLTPYRYLDFTKESQP